MATIALTRPLAPHNTSTTITNPITPPLSLDGISTNSSTTSTTPASAHAASPIPNKHIPHCPTGPVKAVDLDSPPTSPKVRTKTQHQSSILYPPDGFNRLVSGPLAIYEIDASEVAEALDHASRQPLPDPSTVFPWFHGLHPNNHVQQGFFSARRRLHRRTPIPLRAVTLVKADGELHIARLKGAIAPEELIQPNSAPAFIDPDPRDGFSVRNFHIQPTKIALTSDIIVYGDDLQAARKLAWDMAAARQQWVESQIASGGSCPLYSTFVCTSPFEEFEKNHPEIVAVDATGCHTGQVIDFVLQERKEMWDMTKSSEIHHNVFMGPTPEPGSLEEKRYDVLIECSDFGRLNAASLEKVAKSGSEADRQSFHDFPSSGSILPPTWSHTEADGVLDTCRWIYHLAHGTYPEDTDTDADGDFLMEPENEEACSPSRPRKVLIHCGDGYTESSMLGIAYYSYSTGRPVPDAWLHLHTKEKRNFFAYPTDVALLTSIAPRLLRESPACAGQSLEATTQLLRNEPGWVQGLDGSFPSRILDYLYLGNLCHANNPDLLRALGIHQILSVGETAIWRDGDLGRWGEDNVCLVQGVQDNGIDPLTDEFDRCLEFIGKRSLLPLFQLDSMLMFANPERGKQRGTATLVHCRVGVSRSATICIAEVMRAMNMSFPRAYCFVRARRLNVIIQPHLRFAYELLRWESTLQQRRNQNESNIKRELEWGEITREIALMNRPYSR
ncbi:hypothetical protein S7711_05242 [Stachybotrys chartarum IBT 7711]|uniref:Uncharacterized protein n=1 Tax=Stachybotrys chartarum (strain CBS 109288 / IBT 7711) TaxID=1280523 RepID=A0A084AGJ4_STACB|nr:hypothetical protein S7711_05242 [Stachybotrys chartarum IBT 7711]